MYNYIITALLIGAFFMCLLSYWKGVQHGRMDKKEIIPKIEINPVKKVKEAVEQHEAKKEINKMQDELDDMMRASKESMLNHIKVVK